MLWHRQAIFESKGDMLSSSAECMIRSWEVWDTKSPADWSPTHKPTELSKIKLKLEICSEETNRKQLMMPYDHNVLMRR